MDHPDQYVSFLTRTPKRIHEKLKELAKDAGTDLTGYLNAVVFTNHINQNVSKTTTSNGFKPGELKGGQ